MTNKDTWKSTPVALNTFKFIFSVSLIWKSYSIQRNILFDDSEHYGDSTLNTFFFNKIMLFLEYLLTYILHIMITSRAITENTRLKTEFFVLHSNKFKEFQHTMTTWKKWARNVLNDRSIWLPYFSPSFFNRFVLHICSSHRFFRS